MHDFEDIFFEHATAGSDLLDLLTPKQLEIELDHSYLRVVCGGRQWGKTTWTAVAHARNSIPGATSLAIAQNVNKARDLLEPGIEWLNKETGAGIRYMRGDHLFQLPNGAKLQLLGVNTYREAEKVRGYTPPFITVEECGSYAPDLLQYLVEEGCAFSQIKWFGAGGRGTALIGTPGKRVRDYWHEQCLGKHGGSVHHATVYDNPHIPDPDGFIEWLLEQKNWTRETPAFRREGLGEFCTEIGSMPYGGWDGVIHAQALAPKFGFTVLCMDFGQAHPNAWVVLRLTAQEVMHAVTGKPLRINKTHVIFAHKEARLTTHQVRDRTNQFRDRFSPNVIVGDPGGGGAQMIADFNRLYEIPILAAKKGRESDGKQGRIWTMGSMLQNHSMLVYEEAKPFADEARTVPWNEDQTDHLQSDRYPDHTLDATHYGIEYLTDHIHEQRTEPEPGTAEWVKSQLAKRKAEMMATIERSH
jgi:hypothetical protein